MGPHLWGLQVALVGVLALGLRMVVFHGHFPSLAPLPGGPLCLAEEEVGTFSHGLGLHGGESPWLVMSKSGAPHSLAARCPVIISEC